MADILRLPRRGPWRIALALAAGGALALGHAPYDQAEVSFVGLIAAIALFDANRTSGQNARTGWLIGLAHFAVALMWIVEPFLVEAHIYGWMAPFALAGMAGGLALFWALAYYAAGRVGHVWALVVFLAAAELARAYVLTGFPWALISYTWAARSVIQWVSVLGPHGLTFVLLVLAMLIAQGLRERVWAALGVLGLAVLWSSGAWLHPGDAVENGRPMVRLIQPNAPQHEKWDPNKIPVFFERQVQFTRADGAPDLTVWPETALPMLLHYADTALEIMAEAAQGTPIVVGIQRSESGQYHNSLVVVTPEGAPGQVYDKHHLVPFGEYMPLAGLFSRFNILGLAARADGGYAPGPGAALLDLGPLGTALPLICYEAVFPQDIHSAPARADMILHLTNDAWFGQHSGPYQHLAQARIRAIEQGLPVLRSANTGVSAVIDGAGRITHSLPLGEAGFIDAPIPAPLPPTIYSKSGDLPILLVLIVLAAAAIWMGGRKSH